MDNSNSKSNNSPMFSNATKFIGGGSIVGATLGSLVLPGAGTLVGVVVGIAIGNLYLSKKDNENTDLSKKDNDKSE